jgi:hypothetical protein
MRASSCPDRSRLDDASRQLLTEGLILARVEVHSACSALDRWALLPALTNRRIRS